MQVAIQANLLEIFIGVVVIFVTTSVADRICKNGIYKKACNKLKNIKNFSIAGFTPK